MNRASSQSRFVIVNADQRFTVALQVLAQVLYGISRPAFRGAAGAFFCSVFELS
jgi:hypothetical protein